MGVLEKNNELDFKLSKLVDKRPKSAICIVLKQGIYCLDYMDSLPDYAVVNNSVDPCQKPIEIRERIKALSTPC